MKNWNIIYKKTLYRYIYIYKYIKQTLQSKNLFGFLESLALFLECVTMRYHTRYHMNYVLLWAFWTIFKSLFSTRYHTLPNALPYMLLYFHGSFVPFFMCHHFKRVTGDVTVKYFKEKDTIIFFKKNDDSV